MGVPVHELTVGVTVMVAVTGELPVLVAVKEGVFPLPLAPKPTVVLELVQVNDPPAGVLEKAVAGTVAPLQ